ncbi:hypothetical protein PHYPSEUDO_011381 [Phytophthora pseudosyringae]|uniref:Apple domain-containing protein n=1 Tax=Phytophthora pseudosyringae TaxID=221518 RepID=A0A8T1VDQ8_9STRA|nr:hypothetical protein PHYPSEUDO_011381 [Phytophthora pseudosyringae]
MLSTACIVGLVSSSVAAIVNAADPSCGLQYSNMNTEGDVVGTVLYPASPEVCCTNCTANPDCQFFVTDDGGWRHIEPKCRLVSKAQTMVDYLRGSAGKNTVVISGREIPAWGKCGDQNGFKLCSQGFYCQPWDSNYFQCIQKPSKCDVYTNVDLYGNDLKRIQGIKPGECCDECDKTMGCLGYTYVNDDPRGTQCYLKNSVDGWVKKIGVHSGVMPYLPPWSKCGDSTGFRPCTDDFYCQPWDWSNYQCIKRPRCYVETNIDYYGNDIKKVTGIGPGECCEECGKTPGCDSYTYVNDDPTGTQCYLKSSSAGRTKKIGAVSGYVTPGMK